MKTKATKLLSFILALTLLLSSFVIVGTTSSAADELTGKTTVANVGFGVSDTGSFTANLAGGTNTMGVVGTKEFDQEFYPGMTPDPYYLLNLAAQNTAGDVTLDVTYNPINLVNTAFVVLDFEFSFESYNFYGFEVDLVGSRNGAEVEGGDFYFNTVNNTGTYYLGDKYNVVDANSAAARIYSPCEWGHYTLVADVVNNVSYVYVNGVLALELDSAFNGAATADAVSFTFKKNEIFNSSAFAFDNITVTAYSAESNVNFADVVTDWEKDLTATNVPEYANITTAPVAHNVYPVAYVMGEAGDRYVYSAYELGKTVADGDYVEIITDHAMLTPVIFRVDEAALKGDAADPEDDMLVDANGYLHAKTMYSAGAEGYKLFVEKASANITPTALTEAGAANANFSTAIQWNNQTIRVYVVELYQDYVQSSTAITNKEGGFVTYNLHGHKWSTGGNANAVGKFSNNRNNTTIFNDGVFNVYLDYGNRGGTMYFNDMTINGAWMATTYGSDGLSQVTRFNNCNFMERVCIQSYYSCDFEFSFNRVNAVSQTLGGANRAFFDIHNRNDGKNINGNSYVKYSTIDSSKLTDGFIRNVGGTNTTGIQNYNFYISDSRIKHGSHFQRLNANAANLYSKLDNVRFDGSAALAQTDLTAGKFGAGLMSNYIDVVGNVYYPASYSYHTLNGDGIFQKVTLAAGMAGDRKNLLPNNDPATKATYTGYIGFKDNSAKMGDFLTLGENQQLLVNLTLNSDLNFNLYVPTSLYKNGNGSKNFLNFIALPNGSMYGCSWGPAPIVTLDNGIEYYKVTWADIDPQNLADDFTFLFGGRNNTDGALFGCATGAATHNVAKTFNVIDYALQVYATGNEATKALMAEIINYGYEAAKYYGETSGDYLPLAKYERKLTTVDAPAAAEYAPEVVATSQTEIKDYVTSAYMVLENQPMFVFTVAQAAKVTLKYTDIATGAERVAVYDAAAGDKIGLELRAYNLTETITIEVEGVGTGTYNLYTYVESKVGDPCEGLAKALYMYAAAAKANIAAAN